MFIDNKLYLGWSANFYASSFLFEILSIIANTFKNTSLSLNVYAYFPQKKPQFNKLMNDCVVMI